jgi:phenylalanyl-tRNA synthetase beta chain
LCKNNLKFKLIVFYKNNYTAIEKLEELAFDFGIEIEEDEIDNSIIFEIAANRPDLLCVENLCYNLRLYLNL